MTISVVCSACGKTVRAYVHQPGFGYPLVRAHTVSEAAAMLLGVGTGDVCPGSGRNDHSPKKASPS